MPAFCQSRRSELWVLTLRALSCAALATWLLVAISGLVRAAEEEQPADETHASQDDEEQDADAAPRVDQPDAEADKPADDAKQADAKKVKNKKESAAKKDKKDQSPKPSVTHHTAVIDGQEIAFTATAGKMTLKTDEGKAKAQVFYIAYTKDKQGDESATPRPVTFCFNGGPGSASVWLHLGMLGPMRVKLDSDARPLPPPHELIPNPYSLLDETDLVFIDPVSTGFSRPEKGEDKKQFHGYDEDLRWVAQFIHDWTSKHNRWASPKFLIGESYGGLRAAGLSGLLMERYHIYLNGIVLLSAVVDFQTISAYEHNDVAYALFLPTYTATAWYHKRLSDELQKLPLADVVAQAERFAAGRYLRALAAGDSLPAERRAQVVKRMAELTGLAPEYCEAANLRVRMGQFGKELLRSERRVVGRFDSRYTGISRNLTGETAETDPSATAVFGAFTSAMNDYLRTALKVEEDAVYEILTDRVFPWDYGRFTNRYVDASETLRKAMTENPYLKVFAACGYYDLATPQFAMVYSRDHLNLDPEVRDNFTLGFYEGGHMMYAHEPSLSKLRDDLLKFYDAALAPTEVTESGENDR